MDDSRWIVGGAVVAESIVDVGVGSEERRNVVQLDGVTVEVEGELVKVVDVDGGVESEERRN